MKSKSVKLDGDNLGWIRDTGTIDSMQFSFCSLVKNKGAYRKELTQVSGWTSCRESLISTIRDGTVNRNTYGKYSLIDRETTKLLVLFKKEGVRKLTEGNMERALRMINFFEREMAWPLSELFKARSKITPGRCYIYVLFGPKQWMSSPYMISLYTLLLRAGKFKNFGRFKTYKRFVAVCNKLVDGAIQALLLRKSMDIWPGAAFRDIDHLNYVADKIMIVLKNQDEIFGNRGCKDLYGAADSYDGITNLCFGKIKDNLVNRRFGKLCKKAGLKLKGQSVFDKVNSIRRQAAKARMETKMETRAKLTRALSA